MIFLILLITAVITMIKFHSDEEYARAAISAVIGIVCGFLGLMFTGLNMGNYNDIKAKTHNVITEYRLSSETIEEWEWVVNQCENINQRAEKIDDNDAVYAWIDILYFFGYCSSPEKHFIIITEDKIEFPEDYNWLPLRKPTNN